jgi:hypothetical protein
MDSMIHVGHHKEVVDVLAFRVIDLIKTCYECHMDQKTIRAALKSLENSVGGCNNTVVSNCHLVNETKEKA